MIVALACTPPTETVWKTNLSVLRSANLEKPRKILCENLPFFSKLVDERLQVLF